MDTPTRNKVAAYLKLLRRHRGEAGGAYDEVATVYDSFSTAWDQHIAAPALSYVNRLIEQRVIPGAMVLDAGAGTGERTLALLEHSQPGKVIALDASKGMLAVAETKIRDARVSFVAGDIRHLPFADNTFDAVISTWVIEIMAHPRAAIQEYIRVIKPGGIVIYAFCSLPRGPTGDVLKYIITKATSKEGPLSHLLVESEWPFHHCNYSSLRQFIGGLTTVATVGKCCVVTDTLLPLQPEGSTCVVFSS